VDWLAYQLRQGHHNGERKDSHHCHLYSGNGAFQNWFFRRRHYRRDTKQTQILQETGYSLIDVHIAQAPLQATACFGFVAFHAEYTSETENHPLSIHTKLPKFNTP